MYCLIYDISIEGQDTSVFVREGDVVVNKRRRRDIPRLMRQTIDPRATVRTTLQVQPKHLQSDVAAASVGMLSKEQWGRAKRRTSIRTRRESRFQSALGEICSSRSLREKKIRDSWHAPRELWIRGKWLVFDCLFLRFLLAELRHATKDWRWGKNNVSVQIMLDGNIWDYTKNINLE